MSTKMITPETRRPSANTKTPPRFTSLVSWPVLVMSRNPPEGLFEFRIVGRQNRTPAQLRDEASQPHRAQRQRQRDVEPAHRDAIGMKLRLYQPEQIEQSDQQDADRNLDDQTRLALHRPRQQQHEWDGEMKEDERDADEPPAGLQPRHVPG